MYKINNIAFETYGIIPGRATGSNLALSGFLDMPERMGKTFHSWGDEHGIEPYVAASQIKYGGRDLVFKGYLNAVSTTELHTKVQTIINAFNAFDDLVDLETNWGTFQVFIKERIKVNHISGGNAHITIVFREPSPINSTLAPTGSATGVYTIDGVTFESLGAFVQETANNFDRPPIKDQAYPTQITFTKELEFTVKMIFHATNFAQLKNNVEKMQALLAAPGLRNINVDTVARNCFNTKGFKIDALKNIENKFVCRMVLPMQQI